jgi:hypothetical protein
MRRDPNVSQVSLTGSWVMSQFRTLIDEREEARRNYEQLKAEIGSIRSALSEPPNESSSKAELNTSEGAGEDTINISSMQSNVGKIEPCKVENKILPVHTSASTAPTLEVAAPGSLPTKIEPNPTPANPERPSANQHSTSKSDSAREVGKIIIFGFGAVLCCPCLPVYLFLKHNRKKLQLEAHELEASYQSELAYDGYPTLNNNRPDIRFEMPSECAGYAHPSLKNDGPDAWFGIPFQGHGVHEASYLSAPVDQAYQNLDTYGPEGVLEMPTHGRYELPSPAPLGSSYLAQVGGGRARGTKAF